MRARQRSNLAAGPPERQGSETLTGPSAPPHRSPQGMLLRCYTDAALGNGLMRARTHIGLQPNVRGYLRAAGVHVPQCVATPCCATFMVTRRAIQRHSRSFYRDLRRFALTPSGTNIRDTTNCHGLEHVWHVIFGQPAILGALNANHFDDRTRAACCVNARGGGSSDQQPRHRTSHGVAAGDEDDAAGESAGGARGRTLLLLDGLRAANASFPRCDRGRLSVMQCGAQSCSSAAPASRRVAPAIRPLYFSAVRALLATESRCSLDEEGGPSCGGVSLLPLDRTNRTAGASRREQLLRDWSAARTEGAAGVAFRRWVGEADADGRATPVSQLLSCVFRA